MTAPLPDPQVLEVTADWTPAPIHCLACGELVWRVGDQVEPCEHVLFLYMTELRYTYVAPRIEETTEAAREIARPTDDEFLSLCPPATVVLYFNHSGVFWNGLSIIVGIEMPVEPRDPTD